MRENIGGARTVVMVAQPCSERNATRAGNVRKSLSSGAVEGQWSRVKRSLARGLYLAERTIRDVGMFMFNFTSSQTGTQPLLPVSEHTGHSMEC